MSMTISRRIGALFTNGVEGMFSEVRMNYNVCWVQSRTARAG
jgi:hypothetical protein